MSSSTNSKTKTRTTSPDRVSPDSSSDSSPRSTPSSSARSSPAPPYTDLDSPEPIPQFNSTQELLYYIYEEPLRLRSVASPDIIVHTLNDAEQPLVGIDAAMERIVALLLATGYSLRFRINRVIANRHFGTVMGVMSAEGAYPENEGEEVEAPFCGVWKFDDQGWVVEHWEHAVVDPRLLQRWIALSAW